MSATATRAAASPADAAPADPSKQAIRGLLEELPDGLGLLDLARQLELAAGIRQAIAEVDRGEGVPLEEVKKEIASWFTK